MRPRLPVLTFALLSALFVNLGARAAQPAARGHWIGTWVSAQQLTEPHNMPPAPGLTHSTLRQFIYPTLSGDVVRVTFSNVFGHTPLVLTSVHIAVAGAAGDAIEPGTDRALQFAGEPGVVIQPGASMISDPLAMPVTALRRLAVTTVIASAPAEVTGHPGSRTTSFFCPGSEPAAEHLDQPVKTEHWYFLADVDVRTSAPDAAAVVALGDSITDGHASTTDANNRWPDDLARRMHATTATAHIAVLNQGIGGNRLLRNGLGPNALARFDRDVLAPPGVRWLIVFEGINDIGTRKGAQAHGEPYASAADIIAALQQIVVRAHAHGIRAIGATITPYQGADFYFTPDGEADREKINDWIRAPGHFDAVIDFDAIVRDPQQPTRLAPAYDSGDHLHPSPAGYEAMARAIDLRLFTR